MIILANKNLFLFTIKINVYIFKCKCKYLYKYKFTSQVAFVGERRVHQLRRVALVLVRVLALRRPPCGPPPPPPARRAAARRRRPPRAACRIAADAASSSRSPRRTAPPPAGPSRPCCGSCLVGKSRNSNLHAYNLHEKLCAHRPTHRGSTPSA